MFRAPSPTPSPPATPEKRGFFAASNPSTTPAGPPPTSYTAASTTPAGLPPSSVFGSGYPQSNSFAASTSHFRNLHRASPSSLRHATLRSEDPDEDAMDEDHDLGSSILSADGVVKSIEGLDVPAIAKSLHSRPTSLHDNDSLILETENVMENIFKFVNMSSAAGSALDGHLRSAVQNLIMIWRRNQDAQQQLLGIGPGKNASPVTKSLFLASLVLQLYHPPNPQKAVGAMRDSEGSEQTKPIPEVLLEWLREYHNQYPNEFTDTLNASPDPCAHERFWDVVLSLTLRGNLNEASQLMKKADFRYAVSALEDGAEQPGYRGKQLGNIQRVVNRAIAILDSCPAAANGDWDVTNTDWAIFRKRVNSALSDLESFAEGSSADRYADEDNAFEAENFGLSRVRSNDLSISTMSRRAESKVPWSIYQSLKYLYGQLLGDRQELVAAATDWVEATISLAVWWDGEEQGESNAGFASSRRSQMRSQGSRAVDARPRAAYQQKLSQSLQQVVSENQEADLQVNTASPVQVGLCCIFDGDLHGLITILQGWSWPVAIAVVEIAHFGSWLKTMPSLPQSIMQGFDKSDLMVLSFAQQPETNFQRDELLVQYANRLNDRSRLQTVRTEAYVDGWELAIDVLGRVDNAEVAESQIGALLDQLDLSVKGRIDKVMTRCFKLQLPASARAMSEKYADDLASNTHDYGAALWYYARAHRLDRIKEVINVLITCSLVQSIAYPVRANLDITLSSFITTPKQSLAQLALLDREGAELLASQMSGYAMLRKFYDLRDQVNSIQPGQQPVLRSTARKRDAIAALIAVIESAADSIHGGLLDTSVESVVQVDGLLVLFGEALVFLNQQSHILTHEQILVLMQAAEDVSTVSTIVYAQIEECLKSALTQAHGFEAPPSPREMLAKSTAALSASRAGSDFSMIGSNLISSGSKSRSSGDTLQRGWDWRQGMKADANGENVLKILRLGLAKEMSRVWTEGQ